MDNYREKVFNLIPSLRYLDGYGNIYMNLPCYFVYFLKLINYLSVNRFDADDCEVDSEGEDDEVNGNEDGDGEDNEEDSEEGWSRI